jgi:hypothetical protein
MSLDKAIKHGKEKRKPYRRSKAFDASCRNHGGCPHCEGGRQHATKKRKISADEEIKETMPILGELKRTKLLKDVTAADIPRGYDAEDVATDCED